HIKSHIVLETPIKAPIQKDQTVGILKIEREGNLITSLPLVALQDIPRAGLWTRITDAIKLRIRSWMGKEV
ncbi:MAG: D-alanyl-D-alanine carboxypeptidase, partial [Gammaproteobacteria bacterium]